MNFCRIIFFSSHQPFPSCWSVQYLDNFVRTKHLQMSSHFFIHTRIFLCLYVFSSRLPAFSVSNCEPFSLSQIHRLVHFLNSLFGLASWIVMGHRLHDYFVNIILYLFCSETNWHVNFTIIFIKFFFISSVFLYTNLIYKPIDKMF